jgi:hypothetical protein
MDRLLPAATTTRSYRLAVSILSFSCHFDGSVEPSAPQSKNVTNRFDKSPLRKLLGFPQASCRVSRADFDLYQQEPF